MKIIWTREDDIQHGFYRPATYNVFRAALDPQGKPVAWWNRVVGPGILIQKGRAQAGTIDAASMEGARNFPYDIPNVLVEWTNKDYGVPIGFWRSVGASQNAFIVESFIDELAHLAQKDPYEYRRALLGKSPRHRGVLELAATKANWGAPLPAGRARGIAVAFSYGSYVAHVAEVSVAPDGKVRVHKLTGAIDCGIAVNPDQVKAQMEGGAVYALTAASCRPPRPPCATPSSRSRASASAPCQSASTSSSARNSPEGDRLAAGPLHAPSLPVDSIYARRRL